MALVGLIKIPPTYAQVTRNNFTGSIGYRFKTARAITLGALGRYVGSTFATSHVITLWSDAGAVLASATITTGSPVDSDGYAYATISYTLASGTFYRISVNEYNAGDNWLDNSQTSATMTGTNTLAADFDQTVFQSYYDGTHDTFPNSAVTFGVAYTKAQIYESTASAGVAASKRLVCVF